MVSVIIPTYNRSNYLRNCLNAILSQSYSNLEIIVIDDGSEDDTRNVIFELAESDKRIKYLNYGKIGDIAKLRNLAICQSNGKYIAFCDDDDAWDEKKIEIQIPHMRNFDLICSNAKIMDAFGKITNEKLHKFIDKDLHLTILDLLKGNIIITSSVITTKEIASLGFVENGSVASAEDYEMWLNLSKKYKFLFLSKELVFFRIHNNTTSANNSIRRIDLILNVIRILSSYAKDNNHSISILAQKSILQKRHELRKLYLNRNEYFNVVKETILIIFVYSIIKLRVFLLNYIMSDKKE